MAKKIKYQVMYQGEVLDTRQSHRTYTHAVIVPAQENAFVKASYVIGYCGSLALAQKSPDARRTEKYQGVRTEIVPVIVVI